MSGNSTVDLPIPEIIDEGGVKLIKEMGPTMGSYYAITIANAANFLMIGNIPSTGSLRDINDMMSTYLETSELSQFNRSSSLDWFDVNLNWRSSLTLHRKSRVAAMVRLI